MPPVATGAIGVLFSVTTHVSGTQSLPLDIIAGTISVMGVPTSIVFYDVIKRSWRDHYLSDMKMGRLANTKS